jgi:hypothetical protein
LLQALGVGTSGVGGFITNALGGNAFSGATDLVQSLAYGEGGGHTVFYNMGQALAAGPSQGFGAALGKSIEGTPWAAGPADVAANAVSRFAYGMATSDYTATGSLATAMASEGAEFASGVGEVKLAYDALTYFGSMAGCALGVIP